MTLVVTDEPPDRPEWIRETIRLVTEVCAAARADLLERVAKASDADLARGTPDDWGVGQVAVHLLLVERGVAAIALNLASGAAPGPTGQPRPLASAVTRDGIASLATKTTFAVDRLVKEFPASPDTRTVARHPFFGELNAFGWLLTLPNHYRAHLEGLATGRKTAL